MKALSLWQPWATLIAVGQKRIETRHWPTTYRGPLAIHATKRRPETNRSEDGPVGELYCEQRCCDGKITAQWIPPEDGAGWALYTELDDGKWHTIHMPLGAIVATAELVDCVRILARGDALGSRKRYVAADDDGLMRVWDVGPLGGMQCHSSWTTTAHEHVYGDYTPGRFAWLLDNVQPLDEPVPARGAQGLWDWEPAA